MTAAISVSSLAAFIVAAHRNTYADKTAAKAPSTRPRSSDYRFARDDLVYHDSYFGMRDFVGQEIVYRRDEPAWGMNYFGVILAAAIDERELYGFLREALMEDCFGIVPVRGPSLFRRKRWNYDNAVDGTLDDFHGVELICRDSQLLYRCRYHGGWIA